MQVRRDHDSLLAIDMVWKVDPGGEDGDEHPEQMTEKERFCVCVILYLVYFKWLSIILNNWVLYSAAEYNTQHLGIILSHLGRILIIHIG